METKDSALVAVSGFKSIGVGTYMAKYLEARLLKDHDTLNCPLDHLADILVVILKEIKKAIVGCDGLTSVVLFYDDGRFRIMPTSEVQEVEKLSANFEDISMRTLLALTDPSVQGTEFANIIRRMSAETGKLLEQREKLMGKRKKILKQLPKYRGKRSKFRGRSHG